MYQVQHGRYYSPVRVGVIQTPDAIFVKSKFFFSQTES